MRKLFQTLKLLNVLRSVYCGWKDAIQIMQLRRMMELSVRTRSSTLKQTDFNILGQCKHIFQ